MDRYGRELNGAPLEGDAEAKLWTRVREFTPEFLAENADAAVVRVSGLLSQAGSLVESFDGPVVARAGSGVCYGYFAAAEGAADWIRKTSGCGWKTVIEFAPAARKASLDLWPNPGRRPRVDAANQRHVRREPASSIPAGCMGAFEQVDLDRCIHCGLCLNACPTYRELGVEMDSPRGRIYQMVQVASGAMPSGETYVEHMGLCLACRACESACPSGVPYGRLIEAARVQIEAQAVRPWHIRVFQGFVFGHLFDSPTLLKPRAGCSGFTSPPGCGG